MDIINLTYYTANHNEYYTYMMWQFFFTNCHVGKMLYTFCLWQFSCSPPRLYQWHKMGCPLSEKYSWTYLRNTTAQHHPTDKWVLALIVNYDGHNAAPNLYCLIFHSLKPCIIVISAFCVYFEISLNICKKNHISWLNP